MNTAIKSVNTNLIDPVKESATIKVQNPTVAVVSGNADIQKQRPLPTELAPITPAAKMTMMPVMAGGAGAASSEPEAIAEDIKPPSTSIVKPLLVSVLILGTAFLIFRKK